MKFSIWSNLDNNLIKSVRKFLIKYNINTSDVEFFLAYPWFNLALDRSIYKNISFEDFFKHIILIKANFFEVRYVFNSLNINILKEKENIDFLLKNLLSLWVNKLTVADINLIEYINKNFWNRFLIALSTINRVNSIEKFEKFYNKYKFDKIVLSHAVNYDFLNLIKLIKYFHENNILVELVWNELVRCDSKCKICYWYLNLMSENKFFYKKIHDCCWVENGIKKFSDSSLIRPEDIYLYEKIWVNYIKLWLRATETPKAIRIIYSYLRRKYIGNFFDLLWDQFDLLWGKSDSGYNSYVENSRLDNFLYLKYFKNFKIKNSK